MTDEFLRSKVILEDLYSKNAKKVSESAKELNDSVKKTAPAFEESESKAKKWDSTLQRLTGRKRKINVEASTGAVEQKIKNLEKELTTLTGNKVTIKAKALVDDGQLDAAKAKVKHLEEELSLLTGKHYKLNLDSGDAALSGASLSAMSGGAGKLAGASALGGVVAGAAVGAGIAAVGAAGAGVKGMYSAGSEREQNMIAMKHFYGGDAGKATAMMDWAKENARKTQYSEADVMSTARRAVQITEGDTKESQYLTQLAQDMASLTPGKTMNDAIEALADAQMGEMERLKEFGFKSNKEAFDAAGGDLTKLESTSGKTLDELFAGGTAEGADSASAKMGTIMGTFESAVADAGTAMNESLKPALDVAISAVEQFAPILSDKLTAFGEFIGGVAEKYAPIVFEKLGQFGGFLGSVAEALKPYAPLLGAVATLVGGIFSNAIEMAGKIISGFFIPAVKWVGEKMQPVFENMLERAKWVVNIFEKIKGAVSSAIDAIGNFVANLPFIGNGKEEKNALGTNFFAGGLSQVNENMQGEIMDLPNGTRIYPYQTTKKLLKKELLASTSSSNSSNIFNINIDAKGSNLSLGQIQQIKGEIVDAIVDAIDNTVPA